MLNAILNNVGPELASIVKGQFGLTDETAAKTVATTKESVKKSVFDQVKEGNVEGLLSMLNSGSNFGSNATFQTILGNLNQDFIQKLGLSPEISSKIATYVLPFILQKLNATTGGKMDKDGLKSILGSGLGDSLKDKAKDLLKGGLGNLFK